MDTKRLALAAIVAWLVDAVYGFVVWGLAMRGQMALYAGVIRTEAAMTARLPLMLAGSLLAMFALAWIYAKGYEGRGGVAEGLRFGVVLGIFLFGFVSVSIYGTFYIGHTLAAIASVISFVEAILIGVVIGALYRPERGATSSAAAAAQGRSAQVA